MSDHTLPVHPTAAPPAEFVAKAFLVRYPNEHTRQGYTVALRQWFEWCYTHGVDPLAATRAHIEVWARQLEQEGRQRSTVGGKLNALAGFYKFAVIDDHIVKDPMLHVNRPHVARESTTNGLRRAELNTILEAAEQHSPRAHALVCLLGLNGMRISEVLGINLTDIGFDRGWHTVTITRKGGRRQTLPLAGRTAWAVTTYVATRDIGPLFVTSTGRRWTRQATHRTIQQLARTAKITRRISPHSFRHTFVTLSLDAGVHPRDVQNSTGHADQRMITYYDRHRDSIERNATHALAAFVAGVA